MFTIYIICKGNRAPAVLDEFITGEYLRKRLVLVVKKKHFDDFLIKYGMHIKIIERPDNLSGSELRRYLITNSLEELVFIVKDNLTFYHRSDAGIFHKSSPSNVREMFDLFVDWLMNHQEIVMTGMTPVHDAPPFNFEHCHHQRAFYGVNVSKYEELNPVHSKSLIVNILIKGYMNRVSCLHGFLEEGDKRRPAKDSSKYIRFYKKGLLNRWKK